MLCAKTVQLERDLSLNWIKSNFIDLRKNWIVVGETVIRFRTAKKNKTIQSEYKTINKKKKRTERFQRSLVPRIAESIIESCIGATTSD